MKYFCKYDSILGNIFLVSDGESLLELKISDGIIDNGVEKKDLEVFQKTRVWLDAYFSGKEPKTRLPLKFCGTPFQKEVLTMLLEIPYGKVLTYKDLASFIALKRNVPKMSAQAIGNAVHHNSIPIIVPCHRVVGQNKNLVGYGLGMDLKIKLLKLEKMDLKGYYFYENKKKKNMWNRYGIIIKVKEIS